MTDGLAIHVKPGKLLPQLTSSGVAVDDVRAVYVRNDEGMTISMLSEHDIPKPLFVESGANLRSIGRKELKRLRSSIQYTY
jgi:hypothetical protein